MTEPDLTAPVDSLLAECVAARREINAWFVEAKLAAAKWVPRPIPVAT